MASSLKGAQSNDVPSVGRTVRLVTCTDVPNRVAGHTILEEISIFFQTGLLRFCLKGHERFYQRINLQTLAYNQFCPISIIN
ncbi:hypothetical protein [Pseudomonas sp. C3-2018]|uniref:hypothetical protein n=1 Tax=Pseudomonas sp. C3-2018 TaxID=2898587 RepID=UPI001E5189C2|nr:hypothetical protein [Pseudomonas sp. C3-2018]MCD4529047.1 hypothetical protein [Pseudomonas sp. C3-2018]